MARTNLENIIPIYRIGDGYVIAKDGSVTVGFILTLPEYDSLSKADFRDDGSGDGMRLYTQLEAAIKDLDEGYTFHQQDIIYYVLCTAGSTALRQLPLENRKPHVQWEAVALKQIIHIHNQTKKHFDTKRLFGRGDRQNSKCHKTLQSCALSILPKAHGRQGLVRISPGLLLHAGTMRPRPLVSRSKIRKLQDGRHRSSRRSAHQITSG